MTNPRCSTASAASQAFSTKNNQPDVRKHPSTEVRLTQDDVWKLPPVALAVYCRILWHARSNDHECYAKVETLQLKGRHSKLSDDAIRKGRAELEKRKLIKVTFRNHRTAIIEPIPQKKSPDDVFAPRNVVEDLKPRELALWCRIYQPDNGTPSGCLLTIEKLIENLGSVRSCIRAFDYMVKAGHIFKARWGKAGRNRYALAYLHQDNGESFRNWKQPKAHKRKKIKVGPLVEPHLSRRENSAVVPKPECEHGNVSIHSNKRDKDNILDIHTTSVQHTMRARYVDKRPHFPISNLNRNRLRSMEVQEFIAERYQEYGFTPKAIPSCMRAYGPDGMLYALAVLRSEIEGNWYRARSGEVRLRKRPIQNPATFLSACLLSKKYQGYGEDWKLPDEWFDDHEFQPISDDGSFEYRKPKVTKWAANGDATEMLLRAVLGRDEVQEAA